MHDSFDHLFPRDIIGRVVLALVSLFFVPVFGLSAIALFIHPAADSALGWLFLIVTEELLISLTMFFGLGMIWAIAMPRWLESLRAAVARKLLIALLLFMLPSVIIAIWALTIV